MDKTTLKNKLISWGLLGGPTQEQLVELWHLILPIVRELRRLESTKPVLFHDANNPHLFTVLHVDDEITLRDFEGDVESTVYIDSIEVGKYTPGAIIIRLRREKDSDSLATLLTEEYNEDEMSNPANKDPGISPDCGRCGGDGKDPDDPEPDRDKKKPCPDCGGTGKVRG